MCRGCVTYVLSHNISLNKISFESYIRIIQFRDGYNEPITCTIPLHITELEFGNNFNQPVDNLPNHILRIVFGDNFNQPVNNLPKNMNSITFGKNFNQPIDNLPSSIRRLHIYNYSVFNQPTNKLPVSLKYLSLPVSNNMDGLPDGLNILIINYKKPVHINLPPNLTIFCIYNMLSDFSPSYIFANCSTLLDTNIIKLRNMCDINYHNKKKRHMGIFDDLL